VSASHQAQHPQRARRSVGAARRVLPARAIGAARACSRNRTNRV